MAINFSLKKNNIQFILFSAIIAFLLASIWYLYKSSPIEALSLEPDSEQIHRGKKSMKKLFYLSWSSRRRSKPKFS